MGYTLCDRHGDCLPLRLLIPNNLGEPVLKDIFTPFWWVCNPCNAHQKRYEVFFRADQENPQYYAWYEVVTTDDTPKDVTLKTDYYKKVLQARVALDDAAAKYRRLTGRGWSMCPPE